LSDDELQRVPYEKSLGEIDNAEQQYDENREDERCLDRDCPILRAAKPTFSAHDGRRRH
jgi:hypothetical protein